MPIPNVPLGIGPPNTLGLTIYSGSSSLDLTTVTGVTLYVTKTLTSAVSVWTCSIVSATATEMTVAYAFTRPAASGTFGLTNGQSAVLTSVSNVVPVGSLLWFSSQPGIFYTVTATSSLSLQLSTPYTGTTNAGATATYTQDVNVLGIYDVAVQLTVSGGIVPAYSFPLNATPPQQTPLHSP